jgi:hypothetical protein
MRWIKCLRYIIRLDAGWQCTFLFFNKRGYRFKRSMHTTVQSTATPLRPLLFQCAVSMTCRPFILHSMQGGHFVLPLRSKLYKQNQGSTTHPVLTSETNCWELVAVCWCRCSSRQLFSTHEMVWTWMMETMWMVGWSNHLTKWLASQSIHPLA